MNFKDFTKKGILIILLSIYIFLVITYRAIYEIFGYKISPILVLAFFLIILSFFLFVNLNRKKGIINALEIRFPSENVAILIILILMSSSLFIPSTNSINMIIVWDKISFLNYFRAGVYIIGLGFIPGSLIYRLIFKNYTLSSKFGINPFIIKITIYPLISFGFIGIIVLLFDQLNFSSEIIGLFLFLMILILFLFETIKEVKVNNPIYTRIIKVNVSKNSLIMLLLAVGITSISIGYQIGWNYLTSGDPWDAIKYATYIGDIGGSPLYINSYPNFWGYITFGLSTLGGLPFINVNTLLAPFSYLFITSTYLLMKALLFNFKTKYIVLSTILLSIFSGIFVNPLISPFSFVNEFYFIYKSYSYFLFFVSLAIFIVLLRNHQQKEFQYRNKLNAEELKLIILSVFLLVLSFLTYIFPLILGILFLFCYSFFSRRDKKHTNLKYYLFFIVFTFLFFLIFDILMNFYLSHIITVRLISFFNYEIVRNVINLIPKPLLTYSLLLGFILIIFIIYRKILKNFYSQKSRKRRFKLNFKFIFRLFLIIFITLFITEYFFNILRVYIPTINLSNHNFFFLFLDKIFQNIGVIGVPAVCLSYYCWKRDKYLFLTLTSWILISFILAFILPLMDFIKIFPLSPEYLSERDIFMMDYWFNRLWFYSIPSLCIFASIGAFELFKKIKRKKFPKKIKISPQMLKVLTAFTLILFSFSGIVITGFQYGNANYRYTDTQIETLDWISENIPLHSGVVVGDNFFMGVGTDSITFVRQYFFYNIFEAEFNESKCIEQIGYLKNNTIQYAVVSQFFISYLNKSNFTNNILIPHFYNITLYQNGDLSVHYAPYFN